MLGKTKIIVIAVIIAAVGTGFAGGKILLDKTSEGDVPGDLGLCSEDLGLCSEDYTGEYLEDDPGSSMAMDYIPAEEGFDCSYSESNAGRCHEQSACWTDTECEPVLCSNYNSGYTSASEVEDDYEYDEEEDDLWSEAVRDEVFDAILEEIPGTWEYRDDVKGTVCTMTFAEDHTVKLEGYNEYYGTKENVSGNWKLVRDDNKAVLVYMLATRSMPRETEFELDNYYFDGSVDLSGLKYYDNTNVSFGSGWFYKIY